MVSQIDFQGQIPRICALMEALALEATLVEALAMQVRIKEMVLAVGGMTEQTLHATFA